MLDNLNDMCESPCTQACVYTRLLPYLHLIFSDFVLNILSIV